MRSKFIWLCAVVFLCGRSVSAQQVSAGGYHSMSIKGDTTLWAWGDNTYGQVGDGAMDNRQVPVQLGALHGISDISGGWGHSIALKNDGTVWTWGWNGSGQLGNGSYNDAASPAMIEDFLNVSAVSAGGSHCVALRAGNLWVWGENGYGQLGDGTVVDKTTPVQVDFEGAASFDAGGDHTLVLKSDGTVWACGQNNYGQLGDGTTQDRDELVQVEGLSGVTSVSAGFEHSLALKSDGTVWAWGHNLYGRLGDGTTSDRITPVRVLTIDGITAISAGGYHSLALKSDGTVWAWGWNARGQLGSGSLDDSSTPVLVTNMSGAVDISAGQQHSLALKSDGTVWAWGRNLWGQLGDGSTYYSTEPVWSSGLVLGGAGVLQFSSAAYSISAGQGTATVHVTRRGGGSGSVSVDYHTSPGSAAAGFDYTAVSGSLSWEDGDFADKTFEIPILLSSNPSSDRAFYVLLTNAVSGGIGSPCTGSVTIASGSPGERIPVYRLYSYGAEESTFEHIWTVNEEERNALCAWPSWQYEGIAWYAHSNQVDGTVPLYRLYSPVVRQHHYTADIVEYSDLDANNSAWTGEGMQYYVFISGVTSAVPAYRFYHAGSYLHHFTISTNELVGIEDNPDWGYVYEGIGYYVFATNVASSVKGSGLDSRKKAQNTQKEDKHSRLIAPAVPFDGTQGTQGGQESSIAGASASSMASGMRRIGRGRTDPLSDSILHLTSNILHSVAVPGDYNGDGIEDLAYYHEFSGQWIVILSADSLDVGSWVSRVRRDRLDACPAGRWMFSVGCSEFDFSCSLSGLRSNAYGLQPAPRSSRRRGVYSVLQWGGEGFVPLCGDYDGNGSDDLAVYHAETGSWFITDITGRLLIWAETWGGNGLVPVSIDYDRDGVTDLAVYSRDTGEWFIRSIDGRVLLWSE